MYICVRTYVYERMCARIRTQTLSHIYSHAYTINTHKYAHIHRHATIIVYNRCSIVIGSMEVLQLTGGVAYLREGVVYLRVGVANGNTRSASIERRRTIFHRPDHVLPLEQFPPPISARPHPSSGQWLTPFSPGTPANITSQ